MVIGPLLRSKLFSDAHTDQPISDCLTTNAPLGRMKFFNQREKLAGII